MISRRSILRFFIVTGITMATPIALHAAPPLDVIASFSILGDMVHQVGGSRVRVTTLVGPDGDGHVYQPTPADARAVANARLLVVNGLGFEGWMERLIEASGYHGTVVTASDGIQPRNMAEPEAEHDAHDADHHHHGDLDPHAWQSLANARIYTRNIVQGLSLADPAGAETYRTNATRYLEQINAVEAEVNAAIAAITPQRRKVVTSHDAFGYFAAAYGIQFLAPSGVSTESEASAADVARLIHQIQQEKIPAVFVENISDPRLLEQITHETDARIGGTLYSDALSAANGPAATYLDLFRHNIRTLADALR
ncbi:MAG: metal ABC transporter substrate-binding protein [Nitrospirae bacterium]|nr:metal ABC transporter substrate-binding protein [Magnetococcales bacterium]HAT51442.1 metal ABC transporter substrate-binding protein [Alphaproteobacteria bacterium]